MKKATLIIAALILGSGGMGRAEEGLQDEASPSAGSVPAPQPAEPLLLASAVSNLPGMSTKSSAGGLPQRLITDLTNVPNPFDSRKDGLEGQTHISYQLLKDAKVSVKIYDLFGWKARGWDFAAGANGGRQGANSIVWDGTNEAGQKVAKGGYLAEVVIETPEESVTAVRKIGVIH